MDNPTLQKLGLARNEEFNRLLREKGLNADDLGETESAPLWKEADLAARSRLKLRGFSQVAWGERYYDTTGTIPQWRIKDKKELRDELVMLAIVVVFFVLAGLLSRYF